MMTIFFRMKIQRHYRIRNIILKSGAKPNDLNHKYDECKSAYNLSPPNSQPGKYCPLIENLFFCLTQNDKSDVSTLVQISKHTHYFFSTI